MIFPHLDSFPFAFGAPRREFLYESDLSGACLLRAVIDFRGASHEKKKINFVALNSFVLEESLLLGLVFFFAGG